MRNHPARWFATSAAILLAACGGNGDPTPVTPPAYAADIAQRHLLTGGGSWAMSGTGPTGQAFTITMTFAPLLDAAFPISGAVASLSRQTFTLTQEGTTTDVGGPTFYFDKSTLSIVGTDNGDGTCSVATSSAALPSSAAAGANGSLVTRSELNFCASSAGSVGITTTRWSIETDAGIALLCWNSTVTDAIGSVIETDSRCVEIGTDGSLGRRARLTITVVGLTIAARNF
ncbi:MAG: hypothetical protein ABIN08_12990 [Caldimonas sp.]